MNQEIKITEENIVNSSELPPEEIGALPAKKRFNFDFGVFIIAFFVFGLLSFLIIIQFEAKNLYFIIGFAVTLIISFLAGYYGYEEEEIEYEEDEDPQDPDESKKARVLIIVIFVIAFIIGLSLIIYSNKPTKFILTCSDYDEEFNKCAITHPEEYESRFGIRKTTLCKKRTLNNNQEITDCAKAVWSHGDCKKIRNLWAGATLKGTGYCKPTKSGDWDEKTG